MPIAEHKDWCSILRTRQERERRLPRFRRNRRPPISTGGLRPLAAPIAFPAAPVRPEDFDHTGGYG